MSITLRWPENSTVTLITKWKIKPEHSGVGKVREGTVALLTAADASVNEITLFINPAIGWKGTYQELHEEWIEVPIETKLTF